LKDARGGGFQELGKGRRREREVNGLLRKGGPEAGTKRERKRRCVGSNEKGNGSGKKKDLRKKCQTECLNRSWKGGLPLNRRKWDVRMTKKNEAEVVDKWGIAFSP